jgi:hypothetical protein
MPILDAERLLTDFHYKTLMVEYYKFVSFVINDINRYSITASTINIYDEESVLFMYKEQFLQMLQETFASPSFTVSHKEVEEGHCAITVSYLKVAT